MRILSNVKRCNAIRLKFGEPFLNSLTMPGLEFKATICSTIKGNSLLYCRNFFAFVIDVMI